MIDPKQVVVVLGAVRDREGRVLLAQRLEASYPDAKNRWELPGGKLEFGEDPEKAVVREVVEETGLHVVVERLLPKIETIIWDRKGGGQVHAVLLAYECSLSGGELSNGGAKDEIGELKFVTLEEARSMNCLPNVYESIKLLK